MTIEGYGARPTLVMPGLVPGIHVLGANSKAWMAGPSPAMTKEKWTLNCGGPIRGGHPDSSHPQDAALLDIKWIRDNPDAFVRGLEHRGFEPEPKELLKQLLKLDEERRQTIARVQAWQERRNRLSKEIGVAKATKDEARASELMEEMTRLKSDLTLPAKTKKSAWTRRCMSSSPASQTSPLTTCRSDLTRAPTRSFHEIRKGYRRNGSSIPAEAAFRAGRGAWPHGFRDGGEAVRLPLRRAEGGAGAARTGARPIHARSAYERVRLHRNQSAAARA